MKPPRDPGWKSQKNHCNHHLVEVFFFFGRLADPGRRQHDKRKTCLSFFGAQQDVTVVSFQRW